MEKQTSESLVWELIKKQNAYLVKRNHNKFSFEPGNLLSRHKFRYSGLARKRVVDLRVNKTGKTIEMRLKRNNHPERMSKSWHASNIHRCDKSFRSVRHVLHAGKYRRDLYGPAQRKAFFLLRSIGRHEKNGRYLKHKADRKKLVKDKRHQKK